MSNTIRFDEKRYINVYPGADAPFWRRGHWTDILNKNLVIANRSCVSCAHNTLRAS